MRDHTAAAAGAWTAAALDRAAALAPVLLPPRGRRGSVINQRRALVVRAALHQRKVQGMSAAARARHRPSGCSLCRVRVPVR